MSKLYNAENSLTIHQKKIHLFGVDSNPFDPYTFCYRGNCHMMRGKGDAIDELDILSQLR